jgi:hypothetical protein
MAGPNWTSIDSLPTGGLNWVPHVAKASDGHLEVFTLDSHGAIWHIRQIAPNGHWNTWALVAPPPNDQVGADSHLETTVNGDDLLEVFTVDAKGGLWNSWQTSSRGGWSQWVSLGDLIGTTHEPIVRFKVTRNADGHLELFTIGTDGALWHHWQLDPGGEWSPWASLAYPPKRQLGGNPVVGTNADGRLEVFSFDGEGGLWHMWQSSFEAGWSQWTSLGNPFAGATRDGFSISVIKNTDGRLELFTSGKDGVLHIWQIAPNGTWSPWASLAYPPNIQLGGNPVVGTNADGRLEVFSFDPQGAYWHTWQQVGGGSWSPWTQFDTPVGLSMQASDLTTGQEADGRLVVFLRDSSGVLWYTS